MFLAKGGAIQQDEHGAPGRYGRPTSASTPLTVSGRINDASAMLSPAAVT